MAEDAVADVEMVVEVIVAAEELLLNACAKIPANTVGPTTCAHTQDNFAHQSLPNTTMIQ